MEKKNNKSSAACRCIGEDFKEHERDYYLKKSFIFHSVIKYSKQDHPLHFSAISWCMQTTENQKFFHTHPSFHPFSPPKS